MIFYFVRHGESEATAMGDLAPIEHDLPLTLRGREEAERVADYFITNKIPMTDVYASSYVRAVQTAEPTARRFNLTVKARDGLRERTWGSLKHLKWPELAKQLDGMNIEERYHFKPEGAESWAEMDTRVRTVLDEIANEHEEGANVAIFSHGGALRGMMTSLAGVEKSKFTDFSMDTGAIAKFTFDNRSFDFINLKP